MKEYEVEVTEVKIVFVEAESKDEALTLAKTEAIYIEPESISTRVLSVEELEEDE